jgi:flagellar biogenesis protein FliO
MNYQPDMIAAAVKMVLSLGAVLLVILALLYAQRHLSRGRKLMGRQKLVQVLASTYIGVKKSISIVHVPGSILVLGVGNDSIRLLTKIDDEAIIARFISASNTKSENSFATQLNKLSSGIIRGNKDHG